MMLGHVTRASPNAGKRAPAFRLTTPWHTLNITTGSKSLYTQHLHQKYLQKSSYDPQPRTRRLSRRFRRSSFRTRLLSRRT